MFIATVGRRLVARTVDMVVLLVIQQIQKLRAYIAKQQLVLVVALLGWQRMIRRYVIPTVRYILQQPQGGGFPSRHILFTTSIRQQELLWITPIL